MLNYTLYCYTTFINVIDEEIRLKKQEISESTYIMKFIFYGILTAGLLYSGYNYFLNEVCTEVY